MLATDIEPVEGGCRFRIVSEELGEREVRLSVPGPAQRRERDRCDRRRWPVRSTSTRRLPRLEDLIAALESFPGMARRLERKGTRSGAVIYDDYAHHPTEVAASLAALRELPHRRLIAVFQPHLYSRTKALASRFGRALTAADEIAVLDVYPAREEPVGPLEGVSGLDVADAAADAAPGRRVEWLVDIDRAAASSRAAARRGRPAGHDRSRRRLQARRPARGGRGVSVLPRASSATSTWRG